MKKENVIDLTEYRKEHDTEPSVLISEELQSAIKHLIHRLRELGPIKQSR